MKWERIKAGEYQFDDYRITRIGKYNWLINYRGNALNAVYAFWLAKEEAEKDFKRRLDKHHDTINELWESGALKPAPKCTCGGPPDLHCICLHIPDSLKA